MRFPRRNRAVQGAELATSVAGISPAAATPAGGDDRQKKSGGGAARRAAGTVNVMAQNLSKATCGGSVSQHFGEAGFMASPGGVRGK